MQLHTGHLSCYLDRAVRAEVGHVRAATSGGRNHALYVAAQNLGQLVAGGALDEATARDAMRAAAADHVAAGAYDHRQAERTITSSLAVGAKRPRLMALPTRDHPENVRPLHPDRRARSTHSRRRGPPTR